MSFLDESQLIFSGAYNLYKGRIDQMKKKGAYYA